MPLCYPAGAMDRHGPVGLAMTGWTRHNLADTAKAATRLGYAPSHRTGIMNKNRRLSASNGHSLLLKIEQP